MLAVVVLVLAVVVGLRERQRVRAELRAEIAALDRDEPGWKLDELEAARAQVPEPSNGATTVRAVRKLMGRWHPKYGFYPLMNVVADESLPAELADEARAAVQLQGPALDAVRPLLDREAGRHPIQYSLVSPLQHYHVHLTETRDVAELLGLTACQYTSAGDSQQALRSIRQAINVARTIGDEPTARGQLTRSSIVAMGCHLLERLLAQSEPDTQELHHLQRLLEREDQHDYFTPMARGEGAYLHEVILALGEGRMTLDELSSPAGSPSWWERWQSPLTEHRIRTWHLAFFPLHRRTLAITRLPLADRKQAMREQQRAINAAWPPLIPLFLKLMNSWEQADRNRHAGIRCAAVALAAERLRRARGHWPTSLAQLEGLLPATCLVDPWTGQPLLLKPMADGLLVYSVGWNEEDNSGSSRNDQVFRLWDAPARRRPPAPKATNPQWR